MFKKTIIASIFLMTTSVAGLAVPAYAQDATQIVQDYEPTQANKDLVTKAYLLAFEEELAKGGDAAALKAALEARFPNLGMGVALDIGSKVATGEMKWG